MALEMMMLDAHRCRMKAAELRDKASRAKDRFVRDGFEKIARQYETLASMDDNLDPRDRA